MKDVSNGNRREVVGVRTAVEMETAVLWLLRSDTPDDTHIHVYVTATGGFGVWLNAPPADRPDPLREVV